MSNAIKEAISAFCEEFESAPSAHNLLSEIVDNKDVSAVAYESTEGWNDTKRDELINRMSVQNIVDMITYMEEIINENLEDPDFESDSANDILDAIKDYKINDVIHNELTKEESVPETWQNLRTLNEIIEFINKNPQYKSFMDKPIAIHLPCHEGKDWNNSPQVRFSSDHDELVFE